MSKELIAEIKRLREGLLYIAKGQNLEYINSYGRAQPDFPLDRMDMKRKAYAVLNASPMTGTQAEQQALQLCMDGQGRYLECLHAVVEAYEHLLPPQFVTEARKDYASYEEKMAKAEFPVKKLDIFYAAK